MSDFSPTDENGEFKDEKVESIVKSIEGLSEDQRVGLIDGLNVRYMRPKRAGEDPWIQTR